MKKCIRYRVYGIVQGVWYRKFVADTANISGLAGWVRNLDDGSVETVAFGTVEQHSGFEAALWRGSPASDVRDVQSAAAQEPEPNNFTIDWQTGKSASQAE